MSSRQFLIDTFTRHQIFIQRYAGSTYRQMKVFVDEVLKQTKKALKTTNTGLSRQRYESIIRELEAINRVLALDMASNTRKQLSNLALYEAGYTARIVDKATSLPKNVNLTTPTVDQIQAAAFSSIVDKDFGKNALSVGEVLYNYGLKTAGNIARTVRIGFAMGKPTLEIANELDSLAGVIGYRDAKTLARTLTNHVAAKAREAFYKENNDIITGYQIVATLDDRTTLECGARDGNIIGLDDELPPYHWNCRTTYIGIVDKKYDVGSDLTGDRAAKNEDGIEHVATTTTYNSWLKTQSKEFQDEVLGPERGKLFRSGMSIDKFVDANYETIPLSRLKELDDAF